MTGSGASQKGRAATAEPLLTVRERDVLKRIAGGLSNKEIAAELGLSATTVAVHARNMYKKIRVHSRKEAIALAESKTGPLFRAPRARGAGRHYVLALDQGSTHSRAVVFDHDGKAVSFAQKRLEQNSPREGWVEQDGLSIWSTQAGVAAEALASAGLTGNRIAAVGITNQRETTLVWDRETGRPVYPAISWSDGRTADVCEQMKRDGRAEWIRDKTGLVPDAFFSATKVKWILDHVAGARRRAEAGRLLFGTVDTWLVWNCTRGEVHVTDASNASRTMLYNIHTGEWDRELLAFFGIPACMLPRVRPSSEVYGVTREPFLADGVPIAGIVGDQQAALFGQRCVSPGMVKCSYGTGCFMMMNTGNTPIRSKNNLLTTIAWAVDGQVVYALEGGIFVAEAALEWLREGLGLIRETSDAEKLAATVPDNGGVYMVPAFEGLGAPHWQRQARGTLMGLTRDSQAGHIARAALEGIAFQTRDVLKAMESDSGISIAGFRVDGRVTENDLLMQFQSDILGVPVSRPKAGESMALGAAYLAGLAVGYWSSQAEIDRQWSEDRRYVPLMNSERLRQLVKGWERALETAVFWGR